MKELLECKEREMKEEAEFIKKQDLYYVERKKKKSDLIIGYGFADIYSLRNDVMERINKIGLEKMKKIYSNNPFTSTNNQIELSLKEIKKEIDHDLFRWYENTYSRDRDTSDLDSFLQELIQASAPPKFKKMSDDFFKDTILDPIKKDLFENKKETVMEDRKEINKKIRQQTQARLKNNPHLVLRIKKEYAKELKEKKLRTFFNRWAIGQGFEVVRIETKKDPANEYLYVGWLKKGGSARFD